jgi:hypothetical protein
MTMTLITTLVIHPALVEAGLEEWVVILIEACIGATVMLCLIFFVAPALNEAFAEDTEVKKVDPTKDVAAGGQTKKL